MGNENLARLAAKVAALLAKAEATDYEPERDALLAKASALQFKYTIDQAMIEEVVGRSQQRYEQVIRAEFCTERNTPLIKAKRELINVIAENHRCEAVLLMPGRRAVVVVGFESDVQFVTMMFNSLCLQMQNALVQAEGSVSKEERSSFRVSFAHGYVLRLYHRFQEISKQQREEARKTTGAELALYSRAVEVQNALHNYFELTKRASYPTDQRSHAAGRQAGYQAGGEADLGAGNRLGTSEQRALG